MGENEMVRIGDGKDDEGGQSVEVNDERVVL